MAKVKLLRRWRICKLCGRKSKWKVEKGKCLFGCLGKRLSTQEGE